MFRLEASLYGGWKSQASHVRNFFNWYLDAAEYLKVRINNFPRNDFDIDSKEEEKYREANAWIYELSFSLRLIESTLALT